MSNLKDKSSSSSVLINEINKELIEPLFGEINVVNVEEVQEVYYQMANILNNHKVRDHTLVWLIVLINFSDLLVNCLKDEVDAPVVELKWKRDEVCSNYLMLMNEFSTNCSIGMLVGLPSLNTLLESYLIVIRDKSNEFNLQIIGALYTRFYQESNYGKLLVSFTKFVKFVSTNEPNLIARYVFIECQLDDFSLTDRLTIQSIIDYYYFTASALSKTGQFQEADKFFNVMLRLPLNASTVQFRMKVLIEYSVNFFLKVTDLSKLYLDASFNKHFKSLMQLKATNNDKFRNIEILMRFYEGNLNEMVELINGDKYPQTIIDLTAKLRYLLIRKKLNRVNNFYLKDLLKCDTMSKNEAELESFLEELNAKNLLLNEVKVDSGNQKYISKRLTPISPDLESLMAAQFQLLTRNESLANLEASMKIFTNKKSLIND